MQLVNLELDYADQDPSDVAAIKRALVHVGNQELVKDLSLRTTDTGLSFSLQTDAVEKLDDAADEKYIDTPDELMAKVKPVFDYLVKLGNAIFSFERGNLSATGTTEIKFLQTPRANKTGIAKYIETPFDGAAKKFANKIKTLAETHGVVHTVINVCPLSGMIIDTKARSVEIYGQKTILAHVKNLPEIVYLLDRRMSVFRNDPHVEPVNTKRAGGEEDRAEEFVSKAYALSEGFVYSEFDKCWGRKEDLVTLFGNLRLAPFKMLEKGNVDNTAYPAPLRAAQFGRNGQAYFKNHSKDKEAEALTTSPNQMVNNYQANAARYFGYMAKGKTTGYPVTEQIKTEAGRVAYTKHQLYFGLEIELANLDNDIRGHDMLMQEGNLAALGFLPCRDGSIDGVRGVEFKSAPMCRDTVRKVIGPFYNIVRDTLKFEAHPDAGLHIHVSRDALTEMQVARLTTFMFSAKNRDLIELVARRKGNRFCTTKANMGFTNDGKMKLREEGHVGSSGSSSSGNKKFIRADEKYNHYVALNLRGDRTIEFRIFASADNEQHLLLSLEFVEALIRFTTPGLINLRPMDFADPVHFTSWLANSDNRVDFPNLCAKLNVVPKKSVPKKIKTKKVA